MPIQFPLRERYDAMKPFAIELYERVEHGETIEHIAATLKIPVERIAMRVRAAERHVRQKRRKGA